MIESALGAVNIYEILSANPRKIWSQGGGGGYDMAVNLGIEMFASFDQYTFPVAYVALAAMTLGIEATGGVFVPNTSGRVDQSDQATAQAAALHAAGIHHAGALHPAFIQPLVSGLSPSEDEISWAHRVIDEYENLCDLGEAVGTLDGKVVDKYEYDFRKADTGLGRGLRCEGPLEGECTEAGVGGRLARSLPLTLPSPTAPLPQALGAREMLARDWYGRCAAAILRSRITLSLAAARRSRARRFRHFREDE